MMVEISRTYILVFKASLKTQKTFLTYFPLLEEMNVSLEAHCAVFVSPPTHINF
jgi:hypothetical protein